MIAAPTVIHSIVFLVVAGVIGLEPITLGAKNPCAAIAPHPISKRVDFRI